MDVKVEYDQGEARSSSSGPPPSSQQRVAQVVRRTQKQSGQRVIVPHSKVNAHLHTHSEKDRGERSPSRAGVR